MCWEIRGGDCLSWCFLDATPPEWKYEDRSKNSRLNAELNFQSGGKGGLRERAGICVNTRSLGVLVYPALDFMTSLFDIQYIDLESTSRPGTTSLALCDDLALSDVAPTALKSSVLPEHIVPYTIGQDGISHLRTYRDRTHLPFDSYTRG